MTEISAEEAYQHACAALGEFMVRDRLLSAEVARLRAENDSLRARLRNGAPEAPAHTGAA